jgi:hypothetical protein
VFYLKNEQQALKVMLLQLRKRRSHFMTVVQGDLVQKRRRGADQIAEDMKRQFSAQMDKTSWRYAPRAKVAVTMHFHARDDQIPTLHNLVKFYLDPLRSVVFNDDRQVGYLAAQCWRPPKRFQNLGDKDASVFIEVERLTDYKRRFDLYFALMELGEFRDYLKWDYGCRHLVDEDDEFEALDDLWLDKAAADFLGLSDETREKLRRFSIMELQRHRALNRIDQLDRPGGPKGKYLRKERAKLRDLRLFTVDLGDLPAKGESKQYKQRIRTRLRKLPGEFRLLFRQILVPIELDVQVTPRALKLGKDLDNIMLGIAPAFKEELLHSEAYLHGYRIYVTDKLSEDNSSGNIRLKLLPLGAISSFEDAMDETFTAAKGWLENQLR